MTRNVTSPTSTLSPSNSRSDREESDRSCDTHTETGPLVRLKDLIVSFTSSSTEREKTPLLSVQKQFPRQDSVTSSEDTGSESTETMSRNEVRKIDEFLESAYPDSFPFRYWLIFFALGMANASDAVEILCMSFLLPYDQFNEEILQGNSGRLPSSAVFFGMLMGGLIAGPLGDVFGRRPTLLCSLTCATLGGVASTFSYSLETLSLCRCISGLGIGVTIPPLFTLATELAPPSYRGRCVTVCAGFWTVGNLFIVAAAMFTLGQESDWRVFTLICALPSFISFFLVYAFVPESPRFLGLNGRILEAVESVNGIARLMLGRSFDETIEAWTEEEASQQFDAASHNRAFRMRQMHNAGRCEQFLEEIKTFWGSARTLYHPGLVKTTWTLKSLWFVLGYASYGLIMWINALFDAVHLDNIYTNALIFALSNIPGNFISVCSVDSSGRTNGLIRSVLVSAAALAAFAYFASLDEPPVLGIVSSACVFQCCNVISWSIVDVITGEMFPTRVRSTGVGLCAMSTRFAAVAAQFVNASLADDPTALLSVSAVVLLLGAAAPLFLPSDMTGKEIMDALVPEEKPESIQYLQLTPRNQETSPRASPTYLV